MRRAGRGSSRISAGRSIWGRNHEGTGLEHLLLQARAADSIVLAFDEHGRPFRLAYRLAWDESWRLRDAALVVTTDHAERSLHLATDGEGHWRDAEGRAVPALDACVDIDIWPTPFTNTFPIRRQPLAVGEQREFLMAWVSAPELTVRPMRQGYTRLANRLYRYDNLEGSGFRAELIVDEDGVVVDYQGVFRRVR